MKKLLFVGVFLVSVASQATTIWHVTTSCNRTQDVPMADNATAEQVADAVRRVNKDLCGTTLKTVTLTFE